MSTAVIQLQPAKLAHNHFMICTTMEGETVNPSVTVYKAAGQGADAPLGSQMKGWQTKV